MMAKIQSGSSIVPRQADGQLDLGFERAQLPERSSMRFDGETYEPALDQVRLSGQMLRVFRALAQGRWLTLRDLSSECGGSEAGVSARLRDLRKARFGAHIVERRRIQGVRGDIFEYRIAPPADL
jgi:hypothetical protein